MRRPALSLLALFLLTAPLAAAPLKMPDPPTIELADGISPLPLHAVLKVSDELRNTVSVVKTSPFDKLVYPTGAWTVALFEKNLPLVFEKVEVPKPGAPPVDADLTLEISIVRFEATVPHPAYNPYTATVVYRIDVFDRSGEKIFTQTATGNGQTSKGMMSGFKAKGLAAESAKLAMVDAARQVLEGLADAPELHPVPKAEDSPATAPTE